MIKDKCCLKFGGRYFCVGMRQLFVFYGSLVTVALLLWSCGGEPRGTKIITMGGESDTLEALLQPADVYPLMAELPIPEGVDDNFNDFLFLFLTSARFQEQRISFPLSINKAGGGSYSIPQGDWEALPIDIEQVTFLSCFAKLKDFDEERIAGLEAIDVSKVDVETDSVEFHHFERQDGKWTLVSVRIDKLSTHPEASFLAFFHRFATDSLYQQSRVSPTLSFSMLDPTGENLHVSGYIDRSQWAAFCPELPAGEFYYIDYEQRLRSSDDRILTLQAIATGDLIMLYFKRTKSSWVLYRLEE